MPKHYHVGSNVPGYLSDNDAACYRTPEDAVTGLGEDLVNWAEGEEAATFSLTAPKFAAYDVGLWVPELGGRLDPKNPSRKVLMSVLGGMSESERQHVQARVRAAMDARCSNEGRHQGGRAPYGYRVVDGGPHPNPRKAQEGYRLRVAGIRCAVRRMGNGSRKPTRSAGDGAQRRRGSWAAHKGRIGEGPARHRHLGQCRPA